MNEKRIQEKIKIIGALEYWELAYLWRHCDAGHPFFDHELPFYKHLEARFVKHGAMTKDMSRELGWRRNPDSVVDKIVRWGNENESV
jgi:hypothetical protein